MRWRVRARADGDRAGVRPAWSLGAVIGQRGGAGSGGRRGAIRLGADDAKAFAVRGLFSRQPSGMYASFAS
jgi:hypothetical protein